MDVALATAGGNPAKLGTVKLSSGLRYDAQTQGFHLQQPSVDDFTPANQGGRLDSRTPGPGHGRRAGRAAGAVGTGEERQAGGHLQPEPGQPGAGRHPRQIRVVPAAGPPPRQSSPHPRVNYRLAESRNVIRLAAGDHIAIHHDLGVAPLGAGIGEVLLQGWPRRQLASIGQAAVDQQPRTVADGGHRLAGLGDAADETQRRLVGAQRVRVDDTTGQHQGIKAAGIGLVQWQVYRHHATPVLVFPALDGRLLRR
ncbi:hypothetical protein G6F59_014568 [Rhizopus arrhizus]|nr:hypothetical protein G6F59_014568 [Rhizopus arrhizus]